MSKIPAFGFIPLSTAEFLMVAIFRSVVGNPQLSQVLVVPINVMADAHVTADSLVPSVLGLSL